MTQLVLHIGYPKTGTTAIQRRLSDHRPALVQQGVLYPHTFNHEYGHHQLPWHLKGDPRRSREDFAKLLEMLDREIQDSGAQRVIISSEGFVFGSDPRRVQQVLAPRFSTVVVAVYLRPPRDWIESDYNQGVKGHRNLTEDFATFLAGSLSNPGEPLNYARTLERWAGVFGWEQMRVRGYSDTNVVDDFLAVTGVTAPVETGADTVPTDNPRLGFASLELLRALNSANPAIEEKKGYYPALAALADVRAYRLACAQVDLDALADYRDALLSLITRQCRTEDQSQLTALFRAPSNDGIPVLTQGHFPDAASLVPTIRALLSSAGNP